MVISFPSGLSLGSRSVAAVEQESVSATVLAYGQHGEASYAPPEIRRQVRLHRQVRLRLL